MVGASRALVVAVMAVAGAAAGADRFIVKDGRATAEIVVAAQPARTVPLAAQDLQRYLARISGATLPIVTEPSPGCPVQVHVGRSAHTDRLQVSAEGLEYGAFRMVSGPSWLVLIGDDAEFTPREPWGHDHADRARVLREWDALTGQMWGNPCLSLHRKFSPTLGVWEQDGRGSFNAVSEFLRGLGVRWFYPGELGEVVPKLTDIPLPEVNRTVRPDFPLRHLYFYYNEFWVARDGNPEAIDDAWWQMRLGLNNSDPILGSVKGHGTVLVHARDEVKQTHPEYFALWGGRRQTEHHGNTGAPCLSSEGLLSQNVKLLQAIFDVYDQPMVSVAPADGYVNLCQCELCRGKGTPERGWYGQLSDYVWSYVDRVAREVYRTHPRKKISCIAYGAYQLPPEKIATLSPNLAVILCRWRSELQDPATRDRYDALMEAWLAKLPSREMYVWDYYLHARPDGAWAGVPVYFPHAIARDLRSLKGVSRGDFIEVYRSYLPDRLPWDALAANHLNCYITTRLYWDADQDVDALLADYYDQFYGPASREMRAFVEYAEANWTKATGDVAVIDRLLELLGAARQAAGDGVYGRRVDLLVVYTDRLKQLRERLAKGRENAPEVRVQTRNAADLKLDGKLDDKFWEGLAAYPLREVETGRPAHHGTSFQAAWAGDSLYLGIRCSDRDIAHLTIGAKEHGDTGVWDGDCVELLLETQAHSYYQLAVSPAGAMVSADRKGGKIDTLWSPGARVAAQVGEDYWSVELCLPVAGDGAEAIDPQHGLAGRQPSRTYPWYFNVCRQRVRAGREKELTIFSPTGKPGFHDLFKFGLMYVP